MDPTWHPDSARRTGSRIEDAARNSGSRMKTGPALNTAWGPGPRIASRMYFRAPHGVHDPAISRSGSHTEVGITYGVPAPALHPALDSGPRTTSMIPQWGHTEVRIQCGVPGPILHPALNSGPRTTSMILRWIPHGCRDHVRGPASHVERMSPHWIPHGMYGITYEVLGLTLNNGSRPTHQPYIGSPRTH